MITQSQLKKDQEETIVCNFLFYIHKKINIQNTLDEKNIKY